MKYVLMNKDTEILSFRLQKDDFGGIELLEKEILNNVTPIGSDNLLDWLSNRQVPKHKRHIRNLLRQCGCEDLESFIQFTHSLSLNDTFWVKPVESKFCWKDVSLYTNPFDETIARIAFEGGLYGEQFSSDKLSPEYGAEGAFDKCWRRIQNDIVLYKAGTEGFANTGLEPYSEFYTSQLSSIICNESINYDLDMYRGKLVSTCSLFTTEKIGFIPISRLFSKNDSDYKIKQYLDANGMGEDFARMIVLDALTINTDRHRNNYGLLVENDTQTILGFSPVFDNNQSLLPYGSMVDLTIDLPNYLQTRPVRIGDDFNEIANMCLTPAIEKDLNNLRGFKFTNHSKYNLPEERISALEKLVNSQIDKIINRVRIYNPVDASLLPEKDEVLPEMFRIEEGRKTATAPAKEAAIGKERK